MFYSTQISLLAVISIIITTAGLWHSSQSDWSLYGSDHKLLSGMTIISVGSVSKQEFTNYQTYEKIEWYEYAESISTDLCFVMPNYIGLWSLGKQSALIVQDENKNFWMAFVKNEVGGVSVEIEAFQTVDCPK